MPMPRSLNSLPRLGLRLISIVGVAVLAAPLVVGALVDDLCDAAAATVVLSDYQANGSAQSSPGDASQVVDLESLGVSFRMPDHTKLVRDGQISPPGFTILSTTAPPQFRIRIDPMQSEKAVSSPTKEVDAHLAAAIAQQAGWTVVQRKELTVAGADAATLWTTRPLDDGTTAIMGWGLVQVGPGSFIVFSAMSGGKNLAAAQAAVSGILGSLTFLPANELAGRTNNRRGAGAELLQQLHDHELIRTLAGGEDAWFRIWSVGDDGTPGEIGYMRKSAVIAPRAAVDSNERDPAAARGADRREGLLVRVQSRTLLSPDGKSVSDTDARFWVALDRSEELWSVIVTDRVGQKTKTIARSGIRPRVTEFEPFPMLTVADSSSTTKDGDTRRWSPPIDEYVTQAEAQVFGRIVKAIGAPKGETALFCYDARMGAVPQRIDRFRKTPTGWELSTSALLDAPPTITTLDERGDILKQVEPGGTIIERIAPEALLSRWKKLGLPTEGAP